MLSKPQNTTDFGILYSYGSFKKVPLINSTDISKNYALDDLSDDENNDITNDDEYDLPVHKLVKINENNKAYLMCVSGPDTYISKPTTPNDFYKEMYEYYRSFGCFSKSNEKELNIFTNKGKKKFKKEMENKYEGKVRVHSITNFYEGTHVDTSISIIGYNKRVKKYIAIF